MLKSLTLLSTLFVSVQASANCDIDPNLLNKACSTEYYAPKNQKQLNEYLQYGKFKDGKLLNLDIKFDIKDKEISIATNCDVKLSRGTSLKASLNGICIKGSSVELKGENKLDSDNKAPVFIASAKSITLRRSFLQTKGEITLASKIFNPFDGEILISRDSFLKSAKINIFTPSNLIINKDSSLKSSEIVLNGGSCEIGDNDDREHDDDRDHGRSCKRFSPKFQYTGKCATNPIPTTIKIASIVNTNDSLNVSYSLEGRPANTGSRWRFDKEAINIGLTSNKNFLFPGRHLIESIVVDQSGYFRKLGLYQNISPNKFNKGQTAVFQFSGLKRSPPKVTAMMGLRKFILTKSDQDPELFSGEIPSDSAGNKLIAIPEFNYKGSFNLVVLPAISNPDAYIGQSIDQLIALLDSINSANQSYLNSKASLGSLLDELKTKILLLPATDKQKVAEYLQANIFADFHGVTSFKKTQERPTTLFGLLIASAYADDAINNIMLGIVTSLNNFSNTLLRNTPLAIGGALVFGGYIGSKYLPKNYQWLGYVGMAAGAIALVRMASAAQDEIINIHNIDQNSLYLKLPNQVNSDQVATFSVWGQAVPLESIAPASPLISQSINAKNNANFELGRINSQLNSVNSTLSLLGFSSQVEPLPLLSFPQTRFPTILSTNYITNVQLLSSEDGQASILSYSKSGNNLLITFKSTKTQSAKLRVTYVNADLGINKNIDSDIVVTVAPKAVINYTKNNLVVNFDSTDPEDPNVSGLTYSWDFGDGNTLSTSSKNIVHTYQHAGGYSVRLTVTDSNGTIVQAVQFIEFQSTLIDVAFCNVGTLDSSLLAKPRETDLTFNISGHSPFTISYRNLTGTRSNDCECKIVSLESEASHHVVVTSTPVKDYPSPGYYDRQVRAFDSLIFLFSPGYVEFSPGFSSPINGVFGTLTDGATPINLWVSNTFGATGLSYCSAINYRD